MTLRWLPNLLSLTRILLVLPFAGYLLDLQYSQAFKVFALASLTDTLDGWLARRFRWQSRLGALLDPMADKLLVITSYVLFAYLALIPLWLAVLVLLRDLTIVGGYTLYRARIGRVEIAPTLLSKVNTLLQLIFVCLLLLQAAQWFDLGAGHGPLLALVTLSTIASGLDYIWRWGKKARAAR